jgi:IS5 family transposase
MRRQGFHAPKHSYRAGNEHDSKKLQELVDGLSGRPRELYADAAYDTEHIRRGLESMEWI